MEFLLELLIRRRDDDFLYRRLAARGLIVELRVVLADALAIAEA